MNCENTFVSKTSNGTWTETPCLETAVYIRRLPNLPFPKGLCLNCSIHYSPEYLEEIENPEEFKRWWQYETDEIDY